MDFFFTGLQETYFGEKKDGRKDGFGTIIFTNGDFYKGLWKEDLMHGFGKYIQCDKGTYEGTFSYNKKHGDGCFHYLDKSFYNGSFVNDKREGYGAYFLYNRLLYSGEWKNDQFDGSGKLYDTKGNVLYSGCFKKGKKHGLGQLFNTKGAVTLEGEWKNNRFLYPKTNLFQKYYRNGLLKYKGEVNLKKKYHGSGTLYDKDGSIIFSGQFYHGKKEGEGTYFIDNQAFYKGQWKNNRFEGRGLLYRTNLSGENLLYEGEFRNGRCCGYGRQFFQNGTVSYEGIFKNSEIKRGKKYDPTGKLVYEGFFKNFLYHGKGVLYKGEQKIIGTFRQGHHFDESSYFVRKFLETRRETFLEKVTKKDLLRYYHLYSSTIPKFKTKKELSTLVLQIYQHYVTEKNKENQFHIDLFGNTIETPCLGNDNNVYDLSSMEYLFKKDDKGKYVNIPYINGKPNFPIMSQGEVLSSYDKVILTT